MARKELTGRCFIEINGAPPVPFDSLSAEEKARDMARQLIAQEEELRLAVRPYL